MTRSVTCNLTANIKPRPVLFHLVVAANVVWHVLLRQEVWVPRWAFKVSIVSARVPE